MRTPVLSFKKIRNRFNEEKDLKFYRKYVAISKTATFAAVKEALLAYAKNPQPRVNY